MYAIKIGKELFKVYGRILENDWLEWVDWHGRGDHGVSRPGDYCDWSIRMEVFPDCVDEDISECDKTKIEE